MPKPKRKDWTNAFKKPCAESILEIFEYITLTIAVIKGKNSFDDGTLRTTTEGIKLLCTDKEICRGICRNL
ncbi:MAG: hypothetical protein U9N40_00965 [Euryarchaeota archaeon]|nr:hypothetical protein [Euryarchaeota archaeon]